VKDIATVVELKVLLLRFGVCRRRLRYAESADGSCDIVLRRKVCAVSLYTEAENYPATANLCRTLRERDEE